MPHTYLNKGFTLIEMLVSLAIIGVILSVVLLSYSTFNDNLALSAAGQELALAIRQTQTYGLAVKETSMGSGTFTSAYGIHIDPSDPTHYIMYIDKNGNNVYDPTPACGYTGSECVEQSTFRNGTTISGICDNSTNCPNGVRSLEILFLRPNPDAQIYFINNGGNVMLGGAQDTGKVILTSSHGKTSRVVIQSTGQVSIQ